MYAERVAVGAVLAALALGAGATLVGQGLRQVALGETSLAEVLRVTSVA